MDEEDLETLPERFEVLVPLIRRWAVSDDAQRSAMQDGTPTEELRALWQAVAPHLEAIDAYLDEHDDEGAHLLGRLAEAAVEASLDLERRAAG